MTSATQEGMSRAISTGAARLAIIAAVSPSSPANRSEIFNALRQTDIDYMEWKTLKMTGQVKEDFITWHFNRLTIRAGFGT